jgi:hypothetical protein
MTDQPEEISDERFEQLAAEVDGGSELGQTLVRYARQQRHHRKLAEQGMRVGKLFVHRSGQVTEEADQCTCGGVRTGYGHEPGCGQEYIGDLDQILNQATTNWASLSAIFARIPDLQSLLHHLRSTNHPSAPWMTNLIDDLRTRARDLTQTKAQPEPWTIAGGKFEKVDHCTCDPAPYEVGGATHHWYCGLVPVPIGPERDGEKR